MALNDRRQVRILHEWDAYFKSLSNPNRDISLKPHGSLTAAPHQKPVITANPASVEAVFIQEIL